MQQGDDGAGDWNQLSWIPAQHPLHFSSNQTPDFVW